MNVPNFPTTGRIPEELQIGRGRVLDVLESRLARGDNSLLLDERRIGKSSIAAAVLARLEAKGSFVVDLDLSEGISDGDMLAGVILRHLDDDDIGPASLRARVAKGRRRAGKVVDVAGPVAEALKELGITDAPDDLLGLLADLVGGSARPGLPEALGMLELTARRQPIVVFLDEVGLITAWDEYTPVAAALARTVRRRHVTFVFAGSHKRAGRKLFGRGGPLCEEGLPVAIPAISASEWEGALPERFSRTGCQIDLGTLTELLKLSNGHPQDTMRLCACCLDHASVSGGRVDAIVLELGYLDASSHPTWGKR